jgi:polyhydroxyalkanoate synthase
MPAVQAPDGMLRSDSAYAFEAPSLKEIMNHQQWESGTAAKAIFEQVDRVRRQRGALLDAAGFGPIETPYQLVYAEPGVKLRRYGETVSDGPVLLIVPAPIKKTYIWDLAPEVSVVRRCLNRGLRVYLAEWTAAGDAERNFGLADYGDRLLNACIAAIESDNGEKQVVLAGHSLGGVLATTFACLHPQHVRATVLLETPLHFGADAGNFAPLVAATPDSRPIEDAFGNVPGSFLNAVSITAAPHVFQWERYIDFSLSMGNPETFSTHMRVERWTHDEFPLPGRLFSDIVELLYRNDQLMNGNLCIGDRQIGPRNMQTPLLSVIDPRSTIIPPQSILPFHEAAASASKKLLQYTGDIGVCIQHVGVLVGTNAHTTVWPAIFDWLRDIGIRH